MLLFVGGPAVEWGGVAGGSSSVTGCGCDRVAMGYKIVEECHKGHCRGYGGVTGTDRAFLFCKLGRGSWSMF